jgi:NADH-quinone oxidoreductase subunit D
MEMTMTTSQMESVTDRLNLPSAITDLTRNNPYLSLDDYDPEGDLLVMNLGPQHPSTHGVLRVKLWMDGEVCVKAVPYIGYLHRGVEKLCEHRTYVQITPLVDKNDYVSPMTNELAVNIAFENGLGITPPPRAQVIRTIVAEMQRIASHLLAVGTWALDLGGALGGGATAFMHTFREREMLLDCFEELTGARFHYNHHTVGGVRHDIPDSWDTHVNGAMDIIESKLDSYEGFLTENQVFRARSVGVGILDPKLGLELGISGPNIRASGVDWDLRRDAPYAAYDRVNVRVATAQAGDCYARYLVRIAEMRESVRLVRVLMKDIPTGPICAVKQVKLPGAVKIPPNLSAYTCIETARGELGTWLVTPPGKKKSAKPYRLKIRPPSLHAVSALPWVCPGNNLSDIIAILGSMDPIMGEVDR